MSKIKIEKGIQMPTPTVFGGRTSKWPFSGMEIGDSFMSPADMGNPTSSAYQFGKRHGRKFAVRQQRDGSGWRVWRTA